MMRTPKLFSTEGKTMENNDYPEFVGIEQIKEKQAWQLDQFQHWAENHQWGEFHRAHYDWWMFPIDQPSSYGYAWTVFEGDIAEFKEDQQFIEKYLLGVRLLALSWGWDITNRIQIANPAPDQKWQNWPIRLYKCARSLRVFGFEDYFDSMKIFAKRLMQNGVSMVYNGRDLGALFR